jgi:hypothetical protein
VPLARIEASGEYDSASVAPYVIRIGRHSLELEVRARIQLILVSNLKMKINKIIAS